MIPIEHPLSSRNPHQRVSRSPSAEIQILAAMDSDIYEAANGRLTCGNTPINLVGSLIMALEKDQLELDYAIAGLTPPDAVTEPGILVSDVPVKWHNPANKHYEDCGMRTGDVWIKRVCGSSVGLVLNGSLAGLIVEPADGSFAYEGMSFGMLFHDNNLSDAGAPYQVLLSAEYMRAAFHEIKKIEELSLLKPYIYGEHIDYHLMQSLDLWKQKWMNEAQGDGTLVHFMFYLCQQLQLPLDTTQFHFTQSV